MTRVLSVDVGGTKTLLGVVDREGDVIGEQTVRTRQGGDDVRRIALLAAEAAHQHRPAAIALGFPEYVDASGALTSHEVLTWAEQPAEAIGSAVAALGIPPERIVVESDVRLGALGEAAFGAGKGASSFLYVSLGTGLSCAFVVEGEPWCGSRGEAIGFGELQAPGGKLEGYASGRGLEARYSAVSGEILTGEQIVARARSGDAGAHEVLVTAGAELGDALADVSAVLDPQLIVLGGGLGTADTPLAAVAAARYRRRAERRPGSAPVVAAALGPRSGLLGAAAAALRTIEPGFGR